MRILTIDAALERSSAGFVVGDVCIHQRFSDDRRGHTALVSMVSAVLHGPVDLIAVTVGPGSFTGLRAALALAQGLAIGAGIPVVGVTIAEAMAEGFAQSMDRELWVAIDSRRHRVFLQRGDDAMMSVDLDAIDATGGFDRPRGPVAIAGDAADEIAARLTASGYDAIATGARYPMPCHIAAIARARARGERRSIAVVPLYIDPPEARATPQRPAPAA